MTARKPAIAVVGLILGLPWVAGGQEALVIRPKALGDQVQAKDVQNPAHGVWRGVTGFRLHLNRTPPMYTSGPRDDGARPTATVRLLRRGSGETFVRLEWTDATAQQLRPGQRLPDVGEEHVYHAQTEGTADFADAACVMLPQQRQAASPGPSITMGDKTTPVDLYYWRAGGGFQVLKASGISTITDTGTAGSGGAVRTKTGWSVVFSVGNAPARTPITFAIWDGAKQHRDGIKYFSLWCEVG